MRLICYPTGSEPPRIVPAMVERDWMEATSGGFAYRCLPLNIANAHGWMILNTVPFMVQWDGEIGVDAVKIQPLAGDGTPPMASSHFGHGILTFAVPGVFRTDPGYDLVVTGPTNEPRDGLQPLTGIVETDWSVTTFTMNWRFTRRFAPVTFGRDEPFCMIYPVPRGLIESTEPIFRSMDQDPELKQAYDAWAASRHSFNADLKVPGSEAEKQKWQKDYFQGATAPRDHRTKLRPKPFEPLK